MYYTYVLLDKRKRFYIGYSSNLKERLTLHKKGKVYSTKTNLPIKLIYYEACKNKYDALKRERYLKSGPGKRYLKNRIKNYMQEKYAPVAS